MKTGRKKKHEKPPAEAAAKSTVASPTAVLQVVPPWHIHALAIAALWVAILAAYSNSFHAGLTFDNSAAIAKDSRIRAVTAENLNLILTREYWYPPSASGLYRPLTTLSYLFNSAILGNGTRPEGYHWINYGLHAINASLLYLLGLVLFRRKAPAFALAALWALHPVLTESVTNIVGRADLLAGFGVIVGLLCYIRAAAASGRTRVRWLAGVALASAIGIFSKESGIVLLAVLPIYDFTAAPPAPWRRRLEGYAAAALPCLVFLWIRARVLENASRFVSFTDNPLVGAGFWAARLTAIRVLGKYLWLLVWPARLSNDYSYNAIPLFDWFHGPDDWKALVSLLVFLALAGVAVYAYRRNRTVAFFLALAAAAMVPTANLLLLIGTIMAERFLYLPSIGILGCIVLAIFWAAQRISPGRAPAVAGVAVAALAIPCAARTWVRNFDWQSDRTLWTAAEKVCPTSYKPRMSLTYGIDQALREYREMFRILDGLPDSWNASPAYLNAGDIYRRKGDALAVAGDKAGSVAWYRKSLDMLFRAQRIQAATDQLRRLQTPGRVFVSLGWWELDEAFGTDYLRLGQYRQAAEAFERARRRHLAADLSEKISVAWYSAGVPRKAGTALLEAVLTDPGNRKVLAEAADLYHQLDPQGCPARNWGSGLNMNCPMVREDACTAAHDVVRLLLENGNTALARQLRDQTASEMSCGGW